MIHSESDSEEQDRRGLLCIVELGRATRLFPGDAVNIVEGLLEH